MLNRSKNWSTRTTENFKSGNMSNAEAKLFTVLLVLALVVPSQSRPLQRVRVTMINGLGSGRILNVHCQSKDDDLGYNAIPDGRQISWDFRVNFWGTALFYCDVDWDDSLAPKGFDACSHQRDCRRGRSECNWMVRQDGRLYAQNPDSGDWEFMPFKKFS